MEPAPFSVPDHEEQWVPVYGGDDLIGHPVPDAAVDLRALVLEARDVPYRVEPTLPGNRLLVPACHYHRALTELSLYEEENRNWPPMPPRATAENYSLLATLSILLLIATFHNVTHLNISFSGQQPIDWNAFGSARAGDIVHGEWWRAVTALTLHAGIVHLCSNLFIGGAIMMLLSREIGSGAAWGMTLAAGVSGNIINAHVQLPTHVSVGASTGVFGAVGILTALSLSRHRGMPRRRMLAVGAGLALLAALGTEGDHTDLGAHFFGFVSGAGVGMLAGFTKGLSRSKRLWNGLFAVAGTAAVAVSWWLALRYGP